MTYPPPDFRRTLTLLAVLVGTVWGALMYTSLPQAQMLEPIFACLESTDGITDAIVQMRGPDGKLDNYPLDTEALEALWTIEGESIWIGYDQGGWDLPAGFASLRFERYWIRGYKDGDEFWAMLRTTPDYSLAIVYENTEPFADANGEHYGYHPCGGWEITQEDVIAALQ